MFNTNHNLKINRFVNKDLNQKFTKMNESSVTAIDIGITRLVTQGEKVIRRSKAEERHDSGRNLRRWLFD